MASNTIKIATTASISQTQAKLYCQKPNKHLKLSNNYGSLNGSKKGNLAIKGCFNIPQLEPQSGAGKSLSRVLQNEPDSFYDAVSSELNRVSEDRDAAFARFRLSFGSSEASLHRRIAQLREEECHLAIEDALNMIILYNFSQIRVHPVPSLSKCLYNGRLEILPSKDWELESIHNPEVLEMVREYLGVALGWKVGSSVSVNWSTTKITRQHLHQVYASSILYGYFLKSASLRHCLEHNLPTNFQNGPLKGWTPPPNLESRLFQNAILGQTVNARSTTLSPVSKISGKEAASLKSYVMGFDMETTEQCGKPRSKEAADLISKHCCSLFGEDSGENNEMILTSLSSLKRLVLEAVAFGCFLWEAEECVNSIYKLQD